MIHKFFSFIVTGFLLASIGTQPIRATVKGKKDSPTAEQIKEKVIKFGTGEKARVTVKLKNGIKLKGYISEAGENSFVVKDAKTNTPTTIAYGDVEKINGKNLSTGAKIAIGAGIGAAVFLVVAVVAIGSALAALSR